MARNEKFEVIEILSGTVCGGKRVGVGDIVEASFRDARFLKAIGKAKASDGKVGKAKKPEPPEAVEPPAPPVPGKPGLNTQNGPK